MNTFLQFQTWWWICIWAWYIFTSSFVTNGRKLCTKQDMDRTSAYTHLIIDDECKCYTDQMLLTLTYWFSSIFVPLTLSWQAWESKSTVSTHNVKVVRTLELPTLPVEDSVCTFLKEEGKLILWSVCFRVQDAVVSVDKVWERKYLCRNLSDKQQCMIRFCL